MAALTPVPKIQFFTANGEPLVGGKLYSYAAGTTTPLVTYTDQAGTSVNTNPVILDSRGEANVWLGTGPYKLRLASATDVDIWTVDDIYSEGSQSMQELLSSSGSSLVGFIADGTGAAYRTVQAKLRDVVSVKDFGAVGDGTTDDTAAIQAGIDATKNGAVLYFPYGTYYCTSTLTIGRGSKLCGEQLAMPDPRSLNQNVTKISFAGGVSGVAVDQGDLESGYVWGISIENLFFESVDGNNGAIGINLRKVANSRFKNVGAEYFTTGLKITFGMFNTYDSCSFQRCGTQAVLLTDEDSVTTTQRFVDCIFRESNWGVVMTTSGEYLMDTVFDHCSIESTKVGGVNIHKGCSVTFIEPYFENVTDGTTPAGPAIRLYVDGTSSRTDTISVCNIVGGNVAGPNSAPPYTNPLVYVGSGAAAVNIYGGLYQRGLHGVQVDAAAKSGVVNAERPSFVSTTNVYTGTDDQRRGLWPQGVLTAGATVLQNYSGRFGAALRTDADTLEIRNSSNANYYTQHSASSTTVQEVNAVGASGASTAYRVQIQNAGTLQEAARHIGTGYSKFTSTGSYAVPNFAAGAGDTLHSFVADAGVNTLLVSNLSTSASANCVRTTKPDITNGFHYLANRTDTAAEVFRVAANGNVTNTNNSYGAISDVKLKQGIVDAASQWADIKALTVKKYTLKDDPNGTLQIGLIAQEVEEISPGLVEETADMVTVEVDSVDEEGNPVKTIEWQDAGTTTKSVKYSVVNLKMLKALQEAMTRIESLEAEVQALKS
jgi:hypothetical protein